jgi:hypothetical protein
MMVLGPNFEAEYLELCTVESKLHGENTGRNVLYACAEGGNLPLTSCPCRVDLCCTLKPEYGPLYWACAYSSFQVWLDTLVFEYDQT